MGERPAGLTFAILSLTHGLRSLLEGIGHGIREWCGQQGVSDFSGYSNREVINALQVGSVGSATPVS
jgi:hypothetical protein